MFDSILRSPPRGIAPLALLLALAPASHADGVTTTLLGSHIRTLATPGYEVHAARLMVGQSSGEVSASVTPAFPTLAADDLDLQSSFVRDGTANPDWTINLGDWWNTNAGQPDFFVFEVGGNDSLQVTPILPGGVHGSAVAVSGWTATGYDAVTGPGSGQPVQGLSFRFSDLRDASGAPLASGQHLSGLVLSSSTIDGASFCAVDPTRPGPKSGLDGSHVRLATSAETWSPLEIWFLGSSTYSELGESPNPFLDLRLQVTFQGPSGQQLEVPGFFAGDGVGGGVGRIWKARFTPPEPGAWSASASFRSGTDVAISLDPLAGQAHGFDGLTLDFQVQPLTAGAEGFHRKGMLRYVGANYLRFDDGDWFLKGGVNSPENLLAYFGFDGVADSGNIGLLHRYPVHRSDWKPGNPDWIGSTTGEDAHGIIGALNYLSQRGVNSVYMLPMNLGGDGQDVCPFVGQDDTSFDRTHYDVGRLLQWNTTFEHAQSRGILLHIVLAETETQNEQWLDGGTLGTERKLFFRELVARFGHHNAIKWNLCEETDWPLAQMNEFADHLAALDAYDHPIAMHNFLDDLSLFSSSAGDTRYSATSVQFSPDLAGAHVQALRAMGTGAGHAWVVDLDENAPPDSGLSPNNSNDLRKRVLWDVYFSGGAGVEWYFGSQPPPIGGDLDAEDFTNRAGMWNYMRTARMFVEDNLNFTVMSARDQLLTGESSAYGGGEVFGRTGLTYAVYYPNASATGTLDLSEAAGVSFEKRWFDPRSNTFVGNGSNVAGGSPHVVGPPPNTPNEDWVLLLERQ